MCRRPRSTVWKCPPAIEEDSDGDDDFGVEDVPLDDIIADVHGSGDEGAPKPLQTPPLCPRVGMTIGNGGITAKRTARAAVTRLLRSRYAAVRNNCRGQK